MPVETCTSQAGAAVSSPAWALTGGAGGQAAKCSRIFPGDGGACGIKVPPIGMSHLGEQREVG